MHPILAAAVDHLVILGEVDAMGLRCLVVHESLQPWGGGNGDTRRTQLLPGGISGVVNTRVEQWSASQPLTGMHTGTYRQEVVHVVAVAELNKQSQHSASCALHHCCEGGAI